jgi:two-component system response regulator HydG
MNDLSPDAKPRKIAKLPGNSGSEAQPGIPQKEKNKKIDFGAYTILVVDDEIDLRDAIVFDLKRRGFAVVSAESGSSALKLIKLNKIDLILSDIRMPNGDGIFLLEQIRSLGFKIPLIFITGFADASEAECLKKGALKVFPKPFDRKALLSFVIEQLAKRK